MDLVARTRSRHRPLMIMSVVMLALVAVCTVGLLVDDRELVGAPVWLKPLKFGISSAIYAVTLAWLLSLQRKGKRWGWWMGTVIAATLSTDVAIVAFQAARGRLSHYNLEGGINQVLQPIFSMSIYLMSLALIALAVQLAVQKHDDRATGWAIRAGLVVTLLGMFSGMLMIANPQPGQIEAVKAGTGHVVGGHSVGVPDGGPGMFLTGWSTTGGDLRIGHFVGMHALQLLPLLALALLALSTKVIALRDEKTRLGLVAVAALAYAGLFALVVWQALRGQPLIAPDLTTLTAAASLLGATVLGVLAVLGAATRRSTAQQPARTAVTTP